jgi:hypothetical protein
VTWSQNRSKSKTKGVMLLKFKEKKQFVFSFGGTEI